MRGPETQPASTRRKYQNLRGCCTLKELCCAGEGDTKSDSGSSGTWQIQVRSKLINVYIPLSKQPSQTKCTQPSTFVSHLLSANQSSSYEERVKQPGNAPNSASFHFRTSIKPPRKHSIHLSNSNSTSTSQSPTLHSNQRRNLLYLENSFPDNSPAPSLSHLYPITIIPILRPALHHLADPSLKQPPPTTGRCS